MWWHFRDHASWRAIGKLLRCTLAIIRRDFRADARHEFYLIDRPSALNAGSITVPSSVRVSP
jgi:hypothetical protein